MSALTRLAATSSQNVSLTDNPDTSFFRQTYRHHTPFSTAQVQIPPEDTIAVGKVSVFTFPNKGDMISTLYLRNTDITDTQLVRDKLEYVRLLIGGQEIVKMTSNNLHKHQALLSNSYIKARNADHGAMPDICPIHFWFSEYWGTALPLCALYNHKVVVEVKWSVAPSAGHTFEAWGTMIWLGEPERDYFMKTELNYLIDQWQNSGHIGDETSHHIDLNFNHPVKVLIVDIRGRRDTTNHNKELVLTADDVILFKKDISQTIFEIYYHYPYGRLQTVLERTPNMPFATNLSSNQPSGTINFSRLNNVRVSSDSPLEARYTNSTVAAVNTNILTIKDGMGRLKFM